MKKICAILFCATLCTILLGACNDKNNNNANKSQGIKDLSVKTELNIYDSGTKQIGVVCTNASDIKLLFEQNFKVEVLQNSDWKEYGNENVIDFDLEKTEVDKNQTKTLVYDVSKYYPKLSSGKYRLKLPYTVSLENNKLATYYAYAYFEIDD